MLLECAGSLFGSIRNIGSNSSGSIAQGTGNHSLSTTIQSLRRNEWVMRNWTFCALHINWPNNLFYKYLNRWHTFTNQTIIAALDGGNIVTIRSRSQMLFRGVRGCGLSHWGMDKGAISLRGRFATIILLAGRRCCDCVETVNLASCYVSHNSNKSLHILCGQNVHVFCVHF